MNELTSSLNGNNGHQWHALSEGFFWTANLGVAAYVMSQGYPLRRHATPEPERVWFGYDPEAEALVRLYYAHAQTPAWDFSKSYARLKGIALRATGKSAAQPGHRAASAEDASAEGGHYQKAKGLAMRTRQEARS